MRFAEAAWLWGTGVALLVAVLLVAGAWLLVRAGRLFGDEARMAVLVTDRPAGPRAVKGTLLVLAVAFGFVALAQPQYGRGTRLVPATNLDVIVVLDYSKSMYARDVTPSRTDRAKSEVGRLIADLPGARFGAVAFAGEPVSFPLTSDGAAIGQFFRQMTPADMPVGGTAIARAMQLGLDLLRRDPLSSRHRRVMVLVTDGEDLEGDPVAVAEAAAREKVTVHVVQIGGRTPEAIPDVDESGNVIGWRKSKDGQPLTTSLSAEGEEQLTKIAQSTQGHVIRSERGATGIGEITSSMRRLMTEELSERVETVYADVYLYPTALALLLLLVEAFVPASSRRRRSRSERSKSGPGGDRKLSAAAIVLLVGGGALLSGCENGLFVRHSPVVDEALRELSDGGAPEKAAGLLQGYLSTGECKAGEIGTPPSVREKPHATVDLALSLFRVAERFGARFGEEPQAGDPAAVENDERRRAEVDCALRVVRLIATDAASSVPLRAEAQYLTGNLEFLRGAYKAAVPAYDSALKLSPALAEGPPDSVGVRAAWNRAIALRRIEEEQKEEDDKPDAGPPDDPPDGGDPGDSGKPDPGDSGKPDPGDGGQQPPPDRPDGGGPEKDPEKDQNEKDQDQKDQDQKPPPEPEQDQAKQAPDRPPLSQDERILDELEQAPTVQEESAKRKAGRMRLLGLEDK